MTPIGYTPELVFNSSRDIQRADDRKTTYIAKRLFKVAHGDPRQPFHPFHQPDRDRYRQLLQHQFDEHLKLVH